MLLRIPSLLSPDQVATCRRTLDAATWVDGKVTAGHQSAQVKRNRQLAEGSPEARALGNVVLQALGDSAAFASAALPRHIYPPLFNRYEGGEAFGNHVDNAIRGRAAILRTDLSATLFLSETSEYDGGELVIDDTYGAHEVKLPAGDLVLYPSTSLHRVTPVTRGVRVASFFWIQSLIRADAQRTLLYDLDRSIIRLRGSSDSAGSDDEQIALTGIYHNLVRMWAET